MNNKYNLMNFLFFILLSCSCYAQNKEQLNKNIIIIDTIEIKKPIIVNFIIRTDNKLFQAVVLNDIANIDTIGDKLNYDTLLKTGYILLAHFIFEDYIWEANKSENESLYNLKKAISKLKTDSLLKTIVSSDIRQIKKVKKKRRLYYIFESKCTSYVVILVKCSVLKKFMSNEVGFIYLPSYMFNSELFYVKIVVPLYEYSHLKSLNNQ